MNAFQHKIRALSPSSLQSRDLLVILHEGIPAMAIFFLLGNPFQTSYLLYLGASPVQIGIALAIPQLANVAQILGALYMQSIENRKLAILILGSLHRVIWASTGLIPFLFPESLRVAMYLPIFGFAFACNALSAVVWASLVGDVVPVSVRGKYFGIRNAVLWGVGSVCLYAGGIILDRYPGGTGFNILFALCGAMAVWNVIAYTFYPNPPFEKSQESGNWNMLVKPFHDRKFLKSMIFISLALFLQLIALPMFTYVMQKIMHTGYQWISAITIAQNVAMMVSYYYWGKLNVHFSSSRLLFWSLPIISASCLVWGAVEFLPPILVLFAAHVLMGIGTGGFNQMMFNIVIGDTPKSDRPIFIGVFFALTGLAGFFGSVLGGYVYEWTAEFPLWVQKYGIFASVGFLLLAFLAVGPAALKVGEGGVAGKSDHKLPA